MEIRRATADDLQAIDEFDIFMGDRLKDIGRNEILVAVTEGKIAGYIRYHNDFYARPFIVLLMVRKEYRRRGIAESLISHVEQEFMNEERIFTSTESSNMEMLRLLDKLGYRTCGVIDHIQKESEIVFSKLLNPQSNGNK